MEKYDRVIKILTIISLCLGVLFVFTKVFDYLQVRARKIADKPCTCNEPAQEGAPANLNQALAQ